MAEPASVFRAFGTKHFIQWSGWQKLEPILRGNGGPFGIGGPRGSGKSWLILRGVEWARERDGVGLWFPTPSDYGAEPFLKALANNFAVEVEQKFPKGQLRWYDRFASIWVLLLGIILILWRGFIFILLRLSEMQMQKVTSIRESFTAFLNEVVVVGGIFLTISAIIGLVKSRSVAKRLVRRAIAVQERIRYSESQKASSEASASPGGPVTALLRFSRERSLVERPLTLASIVYEFRYMISEVVRLTRRPVVIGIDELDKIHDPNDAKKLLRDIKGIFDIEGAHFLVSVSDEARKTLELGSLWNRDEFSSSFYTVIETEVRTPQEIQALLAERIRYTFDDSACLSIGILSAGNLREAVRIADIAARAEPPPESLVSAPVAVARVMESETHAFLQDVVTSRQADDAKRWVHVVLKNWKLGEKQLDKIAEEPVRHWDPPEKVTKTKLWSQAYLEAWRRLVLRIAVSELIVIEADNLDKLAAPLQSVVVSAGYSASVALLMFKEQLGSRTMKPG